MSPVNRWLEVSVSTMRTSTRTRKLKMATVPCSRDLDKPLPAPVKRSGKAKSPAKSGPVNWLPAEVDIVHQNRCAMDWSKMRDYHCNYLMAVNQKTFNLKNHSKYLEHHLGKARYHARCDVHSREGVGILH